MLTQERSQELKQAMQIKLQNDILQNMLEIQKRQEEFILEIHQNLKTLTEALLPNEQEESGEDLSLKDLMLIQIDQIEELSKNLTKSQELN